MSPLKTIALTCAATAALTLPAMAQYGPRGHGPAEGEGAAILYQHSDFRGQSIRVTGPIPHLSQYRFNDTASSIRIQGGSWEVCVDPNFRGRCEILTYPEGELGQLRLNDNISSIRPVAGWGHDRGGWRDRPRGHDRRYDDRPGYGRGGYGGGRYGRNDAPVVLFEDADYRGDALPVNGAIPHLNQLRFNDKVSSIAINSGAWEVCTDPNYRGHCEVISRSVGETGYYRLNDNITSIRPAGRGYGPRPGYNRPF